MAKGAARCPATIVITRNRPTRVVFIDSFPPSGRLLDSVLRDRERQRAFRVLDLPTTFAKDPPAPPLRTLFRNGEPANVLEIDCWKRLQNPNRTVCLRDQRNHCELTAKACRLSWCSKWNTGFGDLIRSLHHLPLLNGLHHHFRLVLVLSDCEGRHQQPSQHRHP